jgi:hypothetical protein
VGAASPADDGAEAPDPHEQQYALALATAIVIVAGIGVVVYGLWLAR